MPIPGRPRSPHEALVKALFAYPEEAAAMLALLLPERLRASLDLSTVRIQQGSFVDQRLRQRHTDLVLTVDLRAPPDQMATPALVTLLFEHQSKVDRWMTWRFLEYAVRVLADWKKRNPKASRLPTLIPVLLYHGRRRWTAPTALSGLLDHPRPAPELGPELRLHLMDLSQVPDAELRGRAVVQLALLALKHTCDGSLWRHIPAWLEALRRARHESPLGAIEAVLRYMIEVSQEMPEPEVRQLIGAAVGEKPLEEAVSYSFPLLVAERKRALQAGVQRGRMEGRVEGRVEGELSGKRALLGRLLTRRFGPLSEARQRQLDGADEATLDRWTDHVLTADTLDELLSD